MEEAKWYYRNSKLFSHDFLEEHLPKLPEWQIHKDELKAAREKLQSLFEQALPATSEAALEEELIRPILGGNEEERVVENVPQGLSTLLPIKKRLHLTDQFTDQIAHRLVDKGRSDGIIFL